MAASEEDDYNLESNDEVHRILLELKGSDVKQKDQQEAGTSGIHQKDEDDGAPPNRTESELEPSDKQTAELKDPVVVESGQVGVKSLQASSVEETKAGELDDDAHNFPPIQTVDAQKEPKPKQGDQQHLKLKDPECGKTSSAEEMKFRDLDDYYANFPSIQTAYVQKESKPKQNDQEDPKLKDPVIKESGEISSVEEIKGGGQNDQETADEVGLIKSDEQELADEVGLIESDDQEPAGEDGLIESDDQEPADKTFSFEKVVQWMEDDHQRRQKRVDMVPKTWDDILGENSNSQKLASLLSKLPCLSVTEDIAVMKKIRELASGSPKDRPLLEGIIRDINKLLNQESVARSKSNTSLQGVMASILSSICRIEDGGTKIVQECREALPFLIACLSSKSLPTKRCAVATLYELSAMESIREKIGDSGAIEPLVRLINQGVQVDLPVASMAILNLCRMDGNRERAVNEGAIVAVMDKIRNRICLEKMLETLEMVSRHEKAIEEMERTGTLQHLFKILKEKGRSERSKEYCMLIIHTMCGPTVEKMRKIVDGVENSRKILEKIAITGTEEAKKKAWDLLWRQDLVGLLRNLGVVGKVKS